VTSLEEAIDLRTYPDPARHVFNRERLFALSPRDQTLFETYGQGPIVAPTFTRVHHAFEAWADRQPNAIAIEHDGETITYCELNQQANKLAIELRAHGVGRGDNVALFVRRSIPMVVGMLAALKVGASYAPQDVLICPSTQLEHVQEVTESKVTLTLREYLDVVPRPHSHEVLAIDDVMSQVTADGVDGVIYLDSDVADISHTDDRCFILFTSGTTGNPNGVQVTHRNICNILATAPGNLGMAPGKVVSQLLNIAFDMAAWETLGCLMNGATLLIRGKDMQAAAERADIIIATPSVLGSLDASRCTQVDTVAVAGEPCPQPLADTWGAFCRFYNSCGPTETTIINTAHHYRPEVGGLNIGGPTPNNTVYILDDALQPLAIGEVGEMWAGGDCVTAGYLKNPELTADRYRSDPFLGEGNFMFRTRDLGRWTETGELAHHGRTDDQVKVRGFRVELGSITAVLESIPGCTAAATMKYDDRNLIAFMQPGDVDIDAARAAIKAKLPYYCEPLTITALPALPKTDRGKVDKRALLAAAIAGEAPQGATALAEAEEPPKAEGGTAPAAATEPQELIELLDPQKYGSVMLPDELPWIRRIWKTKTFMHYARLAAAVAVANVVTLILAITNGWWTADAIAVGSIGKVTIINLTAAILIRSQHVINLMFKVATSIPTSWPLRIRWTAGKVYHFGGIHVGGAIGGTLWFALLAGSILVGEANGTVDVSNLTLVLTLVLVALLTTLIIFALPRFRAKYHDNFEKVHRFGGWTSLALFWIHTVSFAKDTDGSLGRSLSFWLLIAVSISIALPWTKLRKVPVDITRPSNHAVLANFDYGVTPFAGSSTTLSRSPLKEWHSFANVPAPDSEGYRLTISRAGDWTGQFIDDMPSHVWVKGVPAAGVGNIDKLFKKVVWICTGSGIGPTLPHLLAETAPAHLVWATRDPRVTYGDALVEEILAVQPHATIWNTQTQGKPDMVKLAYWAVLATGAEAVITISNKKLTWEVVEGLEKLGIPAYGAIWDS